MLKTCGLFAESRLLFVETRALFSISPHAGGNSRRKSAKRGDQHIASGEKKSAKCAMVASPSSFSLRDLGTKKPCHRLKRRWQGESRWDFASEHPIKRQPRLESVELHPRMFGIVRLSQVVEVVPSDAKRGSNGKTEFEVDDVEASATLVALRIEINRIKFLPRLLPIAHPREQVVVFGAEDEVNLLADAKHRVTLQAEATAEVVVSIAHAVVVGKASAQGDEAAEELLSDEAFSVGSGHAENETGTEGGCLRDFEGNGLTAVDDGLGVKVIEVLIQSGTDLHGGIETEVARKKLCEQMDFAQQGLVAGEVGGQSQVEVIVRRALACKRRAVGEFQTGKGGVLTAEKTVFVGQITCTHSDGKLNG